MIKATLILLIMRAFRPLTWLRVLCWIGLVANFTFYTFTLVIRLIPCRPQGGTDRVAFLAGMAKRQCAGSDSMIQVMAIVTSAYGLVSDLHILAIPLPDIAKLHIGRRKKMGVYMIFSSGAL